MAERIVFFGCYGALAAALFFGNFFPIPVPLQMLCYTFPILYIGSHLSLKMNEVDATTGERSYQTETVSKKDAMMFPLIGSAALFSLYVVYKFLPVYWVNLLLTTYLTVVGVAAVAESLLVCVERLTPTSFNAMIFSKQFQLPWIFASPDGQYDITASGNQCFSYLISAVLAVLWLITKHWTIHNILAIGFSIQAIRLISVGSFSIATILLCGLFVYDIFWVFGTEVMVTVAKSFEGPAKLIFPTSINPWTQSILGLGDIVIPGILIAMILRFDNWQRTNASKRRRMSQETDSSAAATSPKTTAVLQENVDIHERFSKPYFVCNMIAYEAGLLTTAFVMFTFNSPQPALLYLVPYCLLGLFAPALYWGELNEVFGYSEEEDTSEADGKQLVEGDEKSNKSESKVVDASDGADASNLRDRSASKKTKPTTSD